MSFNGLTIFEIVSEYNFFRVFTVSHSDCFLEFSLFWWASLFPSVSVLHKWYTHLHQTPMMWRSSLTSVYWQRSIAKSALEDPSKILRKSFLRSRVRVTGISHCADCYVACLPCACVFVCVSVCYDWERAIKIPSFLNPHGPPMHRLFPLSMG